MEKPGAALRTFVSCVLDDLINQLLLVVRTFHFTATEEQFSYTDGAHRIYVWTCVLTWCSQSPSICTGDLNCSSSSPADPGEVRASVTNQDFDQTRFSQSERPNTSKQIHHQLHSLSDSQVLPPVTCSYTHVEMFVKLVTVKGNSTNSHLYTTSLRTKCMLNYFQQENSS